MSVAHWRTLLLQLGEVPGEGADARVNRQTLVLGGVLMSGGGLLWGGLALAFGRVTESSIPLGYVVLTLLNLGLLARDRRFPRARNVQVLISLLLPFMFQWSLGGFVDSGGVMLWAMIALVGSLTLSSTRQAVVWLSLYCALTVLSGVFDAELAARAGVDVPAWVQRLFFVINIVTISSIVFTLGIAITQRQRRAIVALEAGQEANRALYERLQETVSSRELDIERLRAAESALTALASGLEAQVQVRTAELETALVRAESGTRAKSEFLAMMSHELRTPLNAVIGFSEVMEMEAFGPIGHDNYKGYVGDILQSGRFLLSMINEILDLVKLESGHMELFKEPLDVQEAVRGCQRLVAEQARRKSIEISVEMPRGIRVLADPKRLRQLLLNILSNAVKFTPEGGRVEITAEAGPMVSIHCRDTGIGIPQDKLDLVFEPFRQVDSSLARKHEGTGLGLPIARSIAEHHGGQLTLVSAPDQGTTVTVRLPAAD